MNFDEAFTKLLGHEGAYSDHPKDNGGKTMWGITEKVARAHGWQGDMRDLHRDLAKQIYHADYWRPCRCDELPISVRFDVFDAAVNSGVSQSAKWLQRAVGVRADGAIGPQTLAAAQAASCLAQRFNGARLMGMTEMEDWPSFSKGWARRVAKNLLEAQP